MTKKPQLPNTFSTLTAEERLEAFKMLVLDKIKIGVMYLSEGEDGILTHQCVIAQCDDVRLVGQPEVLQNPFTPTFINAPEGTTIQ